MKAGYADLDEDDLLDLLDEQPRLRARGRLPWLRMIVLSGLSIAVLVHFARQDERPEPVSAEPRDIPVPVLVAPPPVWTTIDRSHPIYALDEAFAPVSLEARRHAAGGREDTLVVGRFGDDRHGRISLVQGGADQAGRSFFIAVVRAAADAGLAVTHTTQSRMVTTKFGPVEMAAVTLAGPTERECQAFRFTDPEAAFGFQGWLCAAQPQEVDAMQAACFIDRVSLVGGDSTAVKTLFARAERSRSDVCMFSARTASIAVMPPPRP